MMRTNNLHDTKAGTPRVGIASFAIGALAAAVSLSAMGCPNANAIGNFKESDKVFADGIVLVNTETYYFSSVDQSPTNGVPGLIEYCVYTNVFPTAANLVVDPTATGANGSLWQKSIRTQQGYFSFKRPNGNPTNIPLNGADRTMGSANFSPAGPPARTLLLHINDAAECTRLYGGNPGTCWVKPGIPEPECVPPVVPNPTTGACEVPG